MKLMCKLSGHKWSKWRANLFSTHEERFCRRCYIRDKRLNRSDLDESENVFPEKWLDKHMD
ncbi:DUF1660 domain-containing protein [Lactococcus lactis subsp. lactis]|uniref:Prophage pi1 protein 23 n=3 Tax=Lactococcus lactis subsp. lactis TaxID=1360 RepID=Q9CIA8_LACLA|nr:DUF1660 domain-containing protein [Lactococcus lactis]NP_076723.1 DUF1660 domain-containing protein [Lactococcus phage bIL309]MRM77188.1 hypothetical protein [Lactococcus cremoris]AAK04556.1 prophage pi1 protein 23 [Lactococcus lactis subsp. lactis Il1403]AAK08376.1 Orf28 [Lactococcus phage bIL309]AYV52215.1 hypothetical protein EFV54_02465 [Lactococcus lactis]EQC88529.1 hypothetical protein LLDT4_06875 [Lactococcus lactis subsp. lactis bv. diacetylactis str. TIFN4]